MDPIVQIGVFLVAPYLAVALLVIGALYRLVQWLRPRRITGLRSVAIVPYTFGYGRVLWDLIKRVFGFYTLPKMEKDRVLIYGGMIFHYGIWVVLISHFGLVVPLPLTASQHDFVGLYIGGTAGVLAFVGMLILIVRRLSLERMRQLSNFEDYFTPGLLLLIMFFGLMQTLVIRPDYLNTVSPWLTSIIEFHPNLAPIASVGIFTILHVLVACLFIAYIPWGKMVHWVGYLFNPSVTGPSFPVTTEKVRPLPGLEAHQGGSP